MNKNKYIKGVGTFLLFIIFASAGAYGGWLLGDKTPEQLTFYINITDNQTIDYFNYTFDTQLPNNNFSISFDEVEFPAQADYNGETIDLAFIQRDCYADVTQTNKKGVYGHCRYSYTYVGIDTNDKTFYSLATLKEELEKLTNRNVSIVGKKKEIKAALIYQT